MSRQQERAELRRHYKPVFDSLKGQRKPGGLPFLRRDRRWSERETANEHFAKARGGAS